MRYCEERGHDLAGLTAEDLPRIDSRLNPGVLGAITLEGALASRTGYGSTSPVRVKEQIERFYGSTGCAEGFRFQ